MRTAYLVVSNLWVSEVEVVSEDDVFCVVRYPKTDGGFMIRKSRLYETREAAEDRLPYRWPVVRRRRRRNYEGCFR